LPALGNAAAIRRLHQLDPYPSQLALMARSPKSCQKTETHLAEWSYDRGQIEMTIAADHPLDAVFFRASAGARRPVQGSLRRAGRRR